LIYEISHNLVQHESHPDFGAVYVHRKGATRAFPAGHPALAGTMWHETGHPVLIPGSNKDWSYILRPEAGAVHSGYSLNHGAGRRMSRGEASRTLNQRDMDRAYAEAGILVNTNGRVPIDEAAPCYKSSAGHRSRGGRRSGSSSTPGRCPRKGEEGESGKERVRQKHPGTHY
jgi:tRNA-splicing ligase RtcB